MSKPIHIFKQIRRYLNLTQAQVGEKLGTNQAGVSKLEGREVVDFNDIQKLVRGTGYTAEIQIRNRVTGEIVLHF